MEKTIWNTRKNCFLLKSDSKFDFRWQHWIVCKHCVRLSVSDHFHNPNYTSFIEFDFFYWVRADSAAHTTNAYLHIVRGTRISFRHECAKTRAQISCDCGRSGDEMFHNFDRFACNATISLILRMFWGGLGFHAIYGTSLKSQNVRHFWEANGEVVPVCVLFRFVVNRKFF